MTQTHKEELTARYEQLQKRLDALIRKSVPTIVKFDKAAKAYKRGVAETLFPESTHLQDKLVGYDSAINFLAYYASNEPAARLLSHFSGNECTSEESNWFRYFIWLASNNNIGDYLKKMPQADDWLMLLKRSKVSDYGSVANWGKFYVWLRKNAHPSWADALLVNFLNYR